MIAKVAEVVEVSSVGGGGGQDNVQVRVLNFTAQKNRTSSTYPNNDRLPGFGWAHWLALVEISP